MPEISVTPVQVGRPTEAPAAPAVRVEPAPAAAAAAPEVEKPVEGSPPVAEDPKLASKFAQLAKEGKRIRAEKAALAADRAKVEAERADNAKLRELLARKDEDPYTVAKELGLNLDRTIRQALKDGKLDPADAVIDTNKRIDKMLEEQAERDRKAEEDRKAREEQASKENDALIEKQKQTYFGLVAEHIRAKPDDYELIIAHEAFPTVNQVIETYFIDTYKRTGKGQVLEPDEAARYVEDALLEDSKRVVGLKKVQALVQIPPAQPAVRDTARPVRPAQMTERRDNNQRPSPTLSNRQVIADPGVSKGPLTRDQRLENAKAHLRNSGWAKRA